jgi:hypothetical protein
MGKLLSTCILVVAVLLSAAGVAQAGQKTNGTHLLNCRLMDPGDPLYRQHCKAETVNCGNVVMCRKKRFGGRASDGRPERVVSTTPRDPKPGAVEVNSR